MRESRTLGSVRGALSNGRPYRDHPPRMKLCASQAFWLVAYPSQGHEMLFDAHTR